MALGTEQPVLLVVDDDPLLRMTLVDQLTDCGFRTIEAPDPAEAIRILQENCEVHVVLTDVQMPGPMDGFGLAKWIRGNRPGLPVFVASGYSGKMEVADELCAGEEYFTKPFDVKDVAAKMMSAFRSRKEQLA